VQRIPVWVYVLIAIPVIGGLGGAGFLAYTRFMK
jgi:hypothetical protein